jgi:hypothetical protein
MRKEVLLDEKSRIGNILLEHGLKEGRGRVPGKNWIGSCAEAEFTSVQCR